MRVHAHRGNTLAAGAVVLAAAVVEAELRPGPSPAVRTALTLALAALAAFGALRSPYEDGGPRPYQELLLAIAALSATAAVAHVADLVGASPGDPVDAGWVAAVALAGAVLGLGLARAREGTIVLGLGAAAGVVALVAGAGAAWSGADPRDGVRWALFVVAVVLVVAIVLRIDRRYQQAVALADVLAAVVVLLAATFLVDDVSGASAAFGLPRADAGAGLGWQLLLVAAGFGLAGLGATLHERGPGWLGALALVASLVVLARDGGGLVGWPAVLGVLGAVLVVIALRPASARGELFDDEADPPPPPVPFPRRPLAVVARETDPDADDDLL
ncbi:hypothetical protein AB0L40_16395 [Patulibacter sp. NPDC049589]|uniref:hypothetical protein n=1 Tax=Patulibacter sp. NPDC049589 TaxID=3154731 RepID=UPI003418215D